MTILKDQRLLKEKDPNSGVIELTLGNGPVFLKQTILKKI